MGHKTARRVKARKPATAPIKGRTVRTTNGRHTVSGPGIPEALPPNDQKSLDDLCAALFGELPDDLASGGM